MEYRKPTVIEGVVMVVLSFVLFPEIGFWTVVVLAPAILVWFAATGVFRGL